MRKTSLLFLFPLIFSSQVFAAPALGTHLPQKNQLFLGGQTYVVAERELEGDNGELSSTQHFLTISYGLLDWLSVDLKGGAGNINHQPNNAAKIIYPSYLGGGYGFRIKVHETENAKIVCGFQHISIHPYQRNNGETKHKAVLDDWQLSFLGSYSFEKFTPYFGGKWSRMDYIHWVDAQRNRVKSDLDKSIGVIAGVDIPVTEKSWLNFEGQFVDVQAFAGSLNFSF